MKLSTVYSLESLNEAIAIAESHRPLENYLSGNPDRIARSNVWLAVSVHLNKLKKALVEELSQEELRKLSE